MQIDGISSVHRRSNSFAAGTVMCKNKLSSSTKTVTRATKIACALIGILVTTHVVSLSIQWSRAAQDDDAWRRTSQGWELAHALPESTSHGQQDLSFGAYLPQFPPLSTWQKLHRCLVPLSIAMFMATMCPWLVQSLPNRALLR